VESGIFYSKAREIAPEVAQFVEKLMETKAHPEQGYKACSGVLNLARRVGKERIAIACRRALEYNAITYYILEDILKKAWTSLHRKSSASNNRPLPRTPTCVVSSITNNLLYN
jgi:hypothetical protein